MTSASYHLRKPSVATHNAELDIKWSDGLRHDHRYDGRGFARRRVEWLGTTAVVAVAQAGRATPASPVNIYQAPCIALHCEISSVI